MDSENEFLNFMLFCCKIILKKKKRFKEDMLNLKPCKIYAINQLTGTLVYISLSPRKSEELGTVQRCWGHKSKLASDKFKTV